MQITFACTYCGHTSRAEFDEDSVDLPCPRCHTRARIPDGAVQGERVTRCLACVSTELFVRKDFSQRLGVAIIASGFVASSVAWYYHQPMWSFAILFGSALLDLAFYLVCGEIAECYRCHAEYRGLQGLEDHQRFSLETHERYRQQAARLAEQDAVAAAQNGERDD